MSVSTSIPNRITVDYCHNEKFIGMLDRCAPAPTPARVVADETDWRRLQAAAPLRIAATRWGSSEASAREVTAVTGYNSYVIGLVLRPMDMRLRVAGRVVYDGIATPGMMHVSEPSSHAQGLFRGPYDALHLHVPLGLVEECAGHLTPGTPAILASRSEPDRDPIALQLGLALLKAEDVRDCYGRIYADSLGLAIVTRLLALQGRGPPAAGRIITPPLSKWRARRAIDYIETHLGESLCLADLAAAAGLSRMHFAAQFKAFTGYRPHDYVLRRRIARAQQMMETSSTPLVDIALQVGFQSQAHFTTVFRRMVGQPPHAWRQSRKSCV